MKPQYGSRNSPKVDFHASDLWGKVGVSVDGSAFDTDGYANVLESLRGRVDTNVAVQFGQISAKADYNPNDRVQAFVRTGYFAEERTTGRSRTVGPVTEELNDSTWKYVSGGVRLRLPDASTLQATMFGDHKTFNSNFLAIPDATGARAIGRLTLESDRADECGRRHGAVVARFVRQACGQRRSRLALCRRRQHRRRLRRGYRRHPDIAPRCRRHPAVPRHLRAGRVRSLRQRDRHRQRAPGPLAQLRRAQHGDDPVHRRDQRPGAR